MRAEDGVQIGIDIGGTFTDIVALDGAGRLTLTKVPSTPKDLLCGVDAAVRRVLVLAGAAPPTVERFIHGTTVATNAVLEQKGPATAILTTEGFEDVLELGRMKRARMYDMHMDVETPTFLAPRRRRIGIRERLDARGRVLTSLDEVQVRAAVRSLREQGVQAIAVCYLFSFVNPAHERRTREICREEVPDISVSLSSDVDPTFREYERLCVTAFDAYLRPVVRRYLAGLRETLAALGVRAVPLIMRSRGGIVSAALAAEEPVTLFLSGPAGGVIGAKFAAGRSGVRDFVSLDMGGTSNDVAVVRGGEPLIASEGTIGSYPVRTPMVDVSTIGAGGGSIAWIDKAGGLRVGPQSAGAEPGPACYARGGEQATVTDANLILGYLNPARFAGGLMTLDVNAAERAVGALAGRLGLDIVGAAAGIHRVVNARMADQIRLVTIKRGWDPRQFSLVVLGGAGPVHGVALAEEMGMAEVLVPETPGVLSALGLLGAAIEHHHARTLQARTESVDLEAANACLAELDAMGRARMEDEGVSLAGVRVQYSADMRYVGQAYELEVPITAPITRESVPDIVAAFHAVHERVYGYARVQQPAEFVNFRAIHTESGGPEMAPTPPTLGSAPGNRGRSSILGVPMGGPDMAPAPPTLGSAPGDPGRSSTTRVPSDGREMAPAAALSPVSQRPAYFPPDGFVPTAIYDRARLPAGARVAGPAIVEQADTTTVIPPAYAALVDASGNLRITRG